MSVHLCQITLSHFRSHRLARVVLRDGPVAIWGSNGAGKTNFLEALSLLSPGRGMRRAAAEDLMRRPEAVGWKLRATLATPDGLRVVETGAEPGESRSLRIDDKAAPQAALGRLVRVLWLVPSMDRLWTDATEGRRRFLDRLTLSLHPDHGDAVLAYDKAMRDRNRLLRDGVTDARWYQALERQMATHGALIEAARAAAVARVVAAQSEAATAFPAADLRIVGPEGDTTPRDAETLARVFAEDRRRDLAAGRTLSGPHRADLAAVWRAKGVAAALCSTGEQKALLISLVLANARALAEDTGETPILLLDEVAAHLDAGRRAALYEEVLTLGGQAVLTGTGRELFADLAGVAQGIEVRDEDGMSVLVEQPIG